jgi:uncharacterized membrane protein YjjP (DUF1212 family)
VQEAAVDPGHEARELQDFVLQLGSALTEAGTAVSEIQERIVRVLDAFGSPGARVVVLPTSLLVSLGTAQAATIERSAQLGASLRLDQISALYGLTRQAETGDVTPAEGLRRLDEIRDLPPRFGVLLRVLGYVVGAVGICLVLDPEPSELGVAAVLGLIVAVIKLLARDRAWLQVLLPVVAALTVSSATFFAAEHGLVDGTLRPLIASLITLLPGAALTTATVELASGEMIAGSSRLVYGALQLLLLAFGIVAGAELGGLPSQEALTDVQANHLGWWAAWVGVLVFGVGMFLHFSAPRRSLKWLLLVLYAAWIGQLIGDQLFGAALSGFVGALAMTPVAYLIATRPSAPPATVTFLPAFWLLVPGALGLIGVTEIVTQAGTAGTDDFVAAVGTIISIALGVLCGVTLYRNAAMAPGRLRRLRDG